jgi:hypothetical protein
MTISYPLTMPTDVMGFAEVELRAESAVAITQSPFTYQQQVFRHPGQRWTATVSVAPVNREYAEPWIAFLLALNGGAGTFLLGDPSGCVIRGAAGTGGVAVDETQSAGNNTLNLRSLPASTVGVFEPGDYFQLGSGSSATLHKILLRADTDADGKTTVTFWPALRRTASNGALIVYNDARGVFRLANNIQAWNISSNLRYGITFDAVEAL